MPLIYPDNVKRADRLQQLIDDITSTQVQITNSYNVMENAQNKMRAQLDQMMKDNDVDTFSALQQRIKAGLSEEDQEKYQKLVESNEKLGDTNDIVLQVASVLAGRALVSHVAADLTKVAHTVAVMKVVRDYASCFKMLVIKGFDAAHEAFNGVRAALAGISEEFSEISQFGRVLGVAGGFLKFMSWAGVVADAIIAIMETYEGAKQKAELIRGIHETQIARLSATYFNIEATAMMTLVQSLADYMEMAASSDPDDKAAGGPLAKRVMARLSGDMKTIDIDEVQSSLELQDDARSHYSTDDLVRKEVIEGATSDIHSKEYGEKGRASEMKG